MHRARLGLASLLLVLGVLPSVADAAAPPRQLVLAGRGNTRVDFTISTPVTVHVRSWSFSGCGRYRGFYIRPVAGDPIKGGAGAFDVAAFDYAPAQRQAIPLGWVSIETFRFTFPAGRYRAYLFGEGNCEVRIPTSGLRSSSRLRTSAAVPVQFDTRELNATGAPSGTSPRAGTASVPVTVGATTYAHSVVHVIEHADPYAVVPYYTACIEPLQDAACAHHADPEPESFYRNEQLPITGPDESYSVVDLDYFYLPRTLAPGNYQATATAAGGMIEAAVSALFAFDL